MKITKDFKAFVNQGGIKKGLATLICNPCFHCICLFRLAGFFHRIHLSVVSKLIWYFNRLLFHVDLDYRADLAGGFVLIHGLGTVIGKSVKSKGRLTVYQGVTIGGNREKIRVDEDGKKRGQPVLEDGVIIYTNAGVFGPVIISAETVIGAGSVITSDL